MPSTERSSETAFPRNRDELSAQWLGEVLGVEIRRLSARQIGVGKGMMGDVWQLSIDVGSDSHLEIVAKFSSRDRGALSTERRAQIFKREIDFYRGIAPSLKCRTPQIHAMWIDAESAEFLILMEYVATDESISQLAGVPLAAARRVIEELASLHSVSFDCESPIGKLSLLCSQQRRLHQEGFVLSGWRRISALLSDSPPPSRSPDEVAAGVREAYDLLSAQPLVLCHGDVRPDNILFCPDADHLVLIDWQGVALGPQAWDVGYFLAQGLTIGDRREWQDALIGHYVSMLDANARPIDEEQFRLCVVKMGWYSLAVACGLFTLSDPDSNETIRLAKSMGERAVAMLLDNGEW